MKLPWRKRKEEQHKTAANLPSHNDFVTAKDHLDQEGAYRRFGGLTLDESREKVADNFLYHQESFMWMGIGAFCFYFPAFAGYFERREYETHDVSMFCMVCDYRLTDFEDRPDLRDCAERVLNGIRKVSRIFESDQSRLLADDFDTEADIVEARDKLAAVLGQYEMLIAGMTE